MKNVRRLNRVIDLLEELWGISLELRKNEEHKRMAWVIMGGVCSIVHGLKALMGNARRMKNNN